MRTWARETCCCSATIPSIAARPSELTLWCSTPSSTTSTSHTNPHPRTNSPPSVRQCGLRKRSSAAARSQRGKRDDRTKNSYAQDHFDIIVRHFLLLLALIAPFSLP